MKPIDLYKRIEEYNKNNVISDIQYNKLSKKERLNYKKMTQEEFSNLLNTVNIPGTLKSEIFHFH